MLASFAFGVIHEAMGSQELVVQGPQLWPPLLSTRGFLWPESPALWLQEGPLAAKGGSILTPSPQVWLSDSSLLPDVRKSCTDRIPFLSLPVKTPSLPTAAHPAVWTFESSSQAQPALSPQLCLEPEAGVCFCLPRSRP